RVHRRRDRGGVGGEHRIRTIDEDERAQRRQRRFVSALAERGGDRGERGGGRRGGLEVLDQSRCALGLAEGAHRQGDLDDAARVCIGEEVRVYLERGDQRRQPLRVLARDQHFGGLFIDVDRGFLVAQDGEQRRCHVLVGERAEALEGEDLDGVEAGVAVAHDRREDGGRARRLASTLRAETVGVERGAKDALVDLVLAEQRAGLDVEGLELPLLRDEQDRRAGVVGGDDVVARVLVRPAEVSGGRVEREEEP